jgi:cytidylate kinase
VKVYLTASEEERARRRVRDEAEARRERTVEEVRISIAARDAADAGRAASPLITAPGALVVDTTGRTPADIVAEIVRAFRAAEGAMG